MNEPIISPWIFYVIGNLENFRELFINFSAGFFIITLIYCFAYFIRSMVNEELCFNKYILGILVIFTCLFSTLTKLVPDKETAYTMLVASMVTPENIQLAGETADTIITYTGDKTDAFATRLSEIITESTVKVIQEVKK